MYFFRTIAQHFLIAMGFLLSISSSAQDLCENGLAAGLYPCNNVNLLAFMPSSELGGAGVEYNDIWGWTDALDGKEYVMIGKSDGTAFIDISDPVNPVFLGELPSHSGNSIWRDIKVYGDYAFVVSEAGGHGMQVFDLTRLRNVVSIPETFTEDAHYAGFGNAHNIVINEGVALAYAVGTNTFSGGMHIVDISNPLVPVIAGDFAADGYTHDAQVVTYNGPDVAHVGKQIAFNANENTLTIVDVNDPTDTQQLGRVGYSNSNYAHQGWVTEDHTYYLMGDELDEANSGIPTRTIIWDVSDLDAPVVIGEFLSTESAIDHNLYIKGNLVYQSNYRAGLRILDAVDISNANLSEVAYFDLYPASNSAQFNGSWSNYPYFPSGVVAVSHIEEGLFLLQPQFLNASTAQDSYCYEDDVVVDLTVEIGWEGPVNLSVIEGLPAGAVATFSANGVGVGSYTLTLTNLPDVTGDLNLVIEGVGSSDSYRANVSFLVFDCGNDILGCTDNTADNYNPAATIDDGSCTYPCFDATLSLLTDCWGAEVSWTLSDDQGNIIQQVAGGTLGNQTLFTVDFCLEEGCYEFEILDSFGDGLSGVASGCAIDGDYSIIDSDGNVLVQMAAADYGSGILESFCITIPTSGCTDPLACNFNPAASIDNGSCILPNGCTDAAACNFDPAATCDNGSCILPNGCTDATACNFDPAATCDNGSCILPDGCTDVTACNYDVTALCDNGSCVATMTYYEDADNDGFGDAANSVQLCAPQAGFVLDNTDCDDTNAFVYPNAPGTGEGIDNNCNNVIDLDEEQITCLGDFDGDGLRNVSDILILLGDFACSGGCVADMDGDDLVNTTDILAFLNVFGIDCD
ncbi:MAG: choice-of-anchor B domain-containing protein [Flavobacteriales bacterium]|jgi:choice-of-anchor B domain-containing protein